MVQVARRQGSHGRFAFIKVGKLALDLLAGGNTGVHFLDLDETLTNYYPKTPVVHT